MKMQINPPKEIFIWKQAGLFLKNLEKLVTLIKALLPQAENSLRHDISLKNLAKVTGAWRVDNNKRLGAKFEDQYTPFYKAQLK